MDNFDELDLLSTDTIIDMQTFTTDQLSNSTEQPDHTLMDLDNAFKINESVYTNAIDLLLNLEHPERHKLYIVANITHSYKYVREYLQECSSNLTQEMVIPYNAFMRYLNEHQIDTVIACYGEALCREPYDEYHGLEKYFDKMKYLDKVQAAIRSAGIYLSKVKSIHYKTAYKEALDVCTKAAVSSYFPEYFTKEELNDILSSMNYYCKKNTYKTHEEILTRYNLDTERARKREAEYMANAQEKLIQTYTNYLFHDEMYVTWDVKVYHLQEHIWRQGVPAEPGLSKVEKIMEEMRNL